MLYLRCPDLDSVSWEGVLERADPSYLRVAFPSKCCPPWEPGAIVEALVQLKGSTYSFQAQVRKAVPQLPPIVILVEPTEMRRLERRRYYRLRTSITLEYLSALDSSNRELARLGGLVTNISGGGVQLLATDPLEPGMRVRLCLVVDESPLETTGLVSYCRPVSKETNLKYRVGVAFLSLDSRQVELIERFVFRRQMELRQKGL